MELRPFQITRIIFKIKTAKPIHLNRTNRVIFLLIMINNGIEAALMPFLPFLKHVVSSQTEKKPNKH